MIAYDEIWAPSGYVINDNKLIALMNSNAIKRLKYLSQNGAANYIPNEFGVCPKLSRYQHSVGCMILTLILGGSIEEATVALLHDVMHLIFSHTIDFLEEESVSYHEKHKTRLLEKNEKEFQEILGSQWMTYFKEINYPLIKKNNPFAIDICDYVARDSYKNGFTTLKEIRKQLPFLIIEDHQLKCKTEESSLWWNKMSRIVNDHLYVSANNIGLNHYFSQEIVKLMNNGKLTWHDIENYNKNTEINIFNMIKDDMSKVMKNKKFVLLVPNSYDATIYTLVRQCNVRKRYVMPPVINEPVKENEKLFRFMDLVYY